MTSSAVDDDGDDAGAGDDDGDGDGDGDDDDSGDGDGDSHSFRGIVSYHFLGYNIFWGLLGRLFSIVSNELVLGKLKQLAGLGGKGVIGSIGISEP